MYRDGSRLVCSPTDLLVFFDSAFASWMDRFHADHPEQGRRPEPDEYDKVIAAHGDAHEKRYFEKLKSDGRDVCIIERGRGAFDATLAAISAGREVIYQAALRRDDFQGYADFLFRTNEPSPKLAWSYTIADTKLARKPKPYFLLQLCAYAEMIEPILGARPVAVEVITGDGRRTSFRVDDFFFYYQSVKRAFLDAQRQFDPNQRPVPEAGADHGRWTERAEQILEELDHPSLVANITRHQIKRLADADVTSMHQLAVTKVMRVHRMEPAILERLREQAQLQRASLGLDRPKYRVMPPTDERLGLALLPPASSGDVFFDMEGFPLVEGGLEYLFGAVWKERDQWRYRDFWAHDAAEERAAFEAFVDWAWARYRRDTAMHIYHYGAYEVSALKRLMGRYGTREHEVDTFLRGEVFVDLYQIVRQSLRIGEPRYSLKNVEHLYRGAREGDVGAAADSIVAYSRWLELPDGRSPMDSKLLASIRDYNREDCESTAELAGWLRQRQAEHEISWQLPAKVESRDDEPPTNAEAVTGRLLAEIPTDRSPDPERWRVQELIAHLIGFHRREDKPMWWRMFERHRMTDEQLAEDADCLAGLRRTETPRKKVKRSYLYEYAFDPDQDTKLHEGCRVMAAHDLDLKTVIETFDAQSGRLTLKSTKALPDALSLIPDECIKPEPIPASILHTAEAWAATGRLTGALDTLLFRRCPRIRGHCDGAPLLRDGEDVVKGTTRVIAAMDDTTLAIQGPPGAGKTFTSAHAIVALIAAGHRVGISSNSHNAIHKLMEEVVKAAGRTKIRAVKVGGRGDEAENEHIARVASVKEIDFDSAGGPQLVGGTAWAFSAPQARSQFSYLFVDEAGQVSLANLVGMAPAARNLVLVGDQMQLGQPIQGSHPGESGTSALDYLLDGHATIPPHLGIFLPVTYRMHPNVCRFISGAVYQERLKATDETARRVLPMPKASRLVTCESGLLFVPVEHEGNAQASDEEITTVAELVDELKGRRRPDRKQLTDDDILIVAPYNMQVRALRSRLPRSRVGSVDLFQGQEALVVIVSMCASSGEASPRGIEFLFSTNRLNVAISRAQTLAIVVGTPRLAQTRVTSIDQMRLVNLFCRFTCEAARPAPM
jgi:uncharacterized protein